jgi:hypothetical protein
MKRILLGILSVCLLVVNSSSNILAEEGNPSKPLEQGAIVLENSSTVGAVFEQLASVSGNSFVVDNSVKDKPVAPFTAKSWEEARDKLLKDNNLESQALAKGSKVYFVAPPKDPNKKRTQTAKKGSKLNKRAAKKEKPVDEGQAEQEVHMTRLRVVGKPEVTWDRSAQKKEVKVQFIRGEVRNVGQVAAEGISVSAVLPDKSSVRLEGPSALEKNLSAQYSIAPTQKFVKREGTVHLRVQCSNCRK